MAIDKRINFKNMSGKKRERLIEAIKWLKNNDLDGSLTGVASATGGRYQTYVNWYADSTKHDYRDMLDYTAEIPMAGLVESDKIVSITFENAETVPVEDGYLSVTPTMSIPLNDRLGLHSFFNSLFAHSLDGSLASQIVGHTSALTNAPHCSFEISTVEVTTGVFNQVIKCVNSPIPIIKIAVEVNGVETDFTFSSVPSTPTNKWKISTQNVNHAGPAFLPWHRVFLRFFELDLKKADVILGNNGEITLPYWDWFVHNATTDYLWKDKEDLFGTDGDPNDDNKLITGPFSYPGWKIFRYNEMTDTNELADVEYVRREIQRAVVEDVFNPLTLMEESVTSPWTMPNLDDKENVLGTPAYDTYPFNESSSHMSFRNVLEGWDGLYTNTASVQHSQMHNSVHLWVGGTMANVMLSVNDPIFFLHMANVDRIWDQWQKEHPKPEEQYPEYGPLPGMRRKDFLLPWVEESPSIELTSEDVLKIDWT